MTSENSPTHDEFKVYVIQHRLGPVKIGIAKEPERRFININVGTPFALRLKRTANPTDARAVERCLHDHFDRFHMKGEWFDIPESMRDFEIPTHIDDSGRPNTELPIAMGRDIERDWGAYLYRAVKAVQSSKWLTPDVRDYLEEFEDMRSDDDDFDPYHDPPDTDPSLHEIQEDADGGMNRCPRCAHTYEREELACPICGA